MGQIGVGQHAPGASSGSTGQCEFEKRSSSGKRIGSQTVEVAIDALKETMRLRCGDIEWPKRIQYRFDAGRYELKCGSRQVLIERAAIDLLDSNIVPGGTPHFPYPSSESTHSWRDQRDLQFQHEEGCETAAVINLNH